MRKQLQQNADSKKLGRREFLGKSAGAVVIGAGILGGAGRALAEALPTMGTPDWKHPEARCPRY